MTLEYVKNQSAKTLFVRSASVITTAVVVLSCNSSYFKSYHPNRCWTNCPARKGLPFAFVGFLLLSSDNVYERSMLKPSQLCTLLIVGWHTNVIHRVRVLWIHLAPLGPSLLTPTTAWQYPPSSTIFLPSCYVFSSDLYTLSAP